MRAWGQGLALAVLLALATAAVSLGAEVRQYSNIEYAKQLYEEAKQVEPAATSARELAAVIHNRIQCYREHSKPHDRIQICHMAYIKGIVEAARKNIGSHPELGLFMRAVQGCPMVYSMCMGDKADDEACRVRERQCIDSQLDRYWRGAALPHKRDE